MKNSVKPNSAAIRRQVTKIMVRQAHHDTMFREEFDNESSRVGAHGATANQGDESGFAGSKAEDELEKNKMKNSVKPNSATIIKVKSPAKINLTLDILGRDGRTGYHFVDTIMTVAPDLYDEITIEPLPYNQIIISSAHPDIPLDEKNSCYRAARLLSSLQKKPQGARIHLKKNIPPGSGLGGAAGNAAATMIALNEIWRLGLNDDQLSDLGAEIGMDVPFFIRGGTAYCTGFGEKIEPLAAIGELKIKLEFLPFAVNSKEAYAKVDLARTGRRFKQSLALKDMIQSGNIAEIHDLLHNDFELFVSHPPLIAKAKEKLLKQGAKVAQLTGSGSAIFGLF